MLERVFEIGKAQAQGDSRSLNEAQRYMNQSFIHGVPLIEVVAKGLSMKSLTGKKVLNQYKMIVNAFETEVALWQMDVSRITSNFPNKISENILNAILEIKNGNFSFQPGGFDGRYGELVLGQKLPYFGHNVVVNPEDGSSS